MHEIKEYLELAILMGIAIIIFGYWFKWYYHFYYKASPYLKETLNKIKEKEALGKKLTLNEKLHLYSTVKSSVVQSILLKIGSTIVVMGIIIINIL